ncbi:hypothetical protein U9M48_017383 [Paspalum notatum var. saurae]|uniref:Uncharacterized protein n=1 Tax=Paspalum notatum var. saurae TaxID=547442 RepID=A0AAQ3T8F1_PASNO
MRVMSVHPGFGANREPRASRRTTGFSTV